MRPILPCGPTAFLVEVGSPHEAAALHRALDAQRPTGCVEIVPAARTVLLSFTSAEERLAAEDAVACLPGMPAPTLEMDTLTIPVCYDGEDLADIARLSGLEPSEVIELHSNATYEAAFGGFAPGFVYLTGLDERLRLPRRSSPRTSVPSGSVAIADEFSAVYPRSSPGGWHLLGHTELVLFDAGRDPAVLIAPGMRIRFEAVQR